jgi:hypothetical protein
VRVHFAWKRLRIHTQYLYSFVLQFLEELLNTLFFEYAVNPTIVNREHENAAIALNFV